LKYVSVMNRDQQLKLLGDRIRALREGQKVTQDQLAFKAGFARSYYSGVERGVRNISAVNLIQLAKALDCEVGDLFPLSIKL
jgi:transcriptional regulator with XRE-family HTH domain